MPRLALYFMHQGDLLTLSLSHFAGASSFIQLFTNPPYLGPNQIEPFENIKFDVAKMLNSIFDGIE